MTDDFAVCPKCKCIDADFIELGDRARVPGMVICTDCLKALHQSDIQWLHVEY